MTDLVTFGESMLRFSPPTGEPLERTDTLDVHAAGAESNVAVAAQRLGLDTAWLSKLPDSPLGRRVLSELHSHGVDTDVVLDEGRQGVYYIDRESITERRNVIYDRDDASVRTTRVEDLPLDRVRSADMFYTTGITPALSATLFDTTSELLDIAGDADVTTGFDVNYRSKLWTPAEARDTLVDLLPSVDLLFVPERDAELIFEQTGPVEERAAYFADEFGIDTVVVTQGSDGATALRDGSAVRADTFEVETIDSIGSGDAFVGGFLARYLDGDDLTTALRYGCATAALKRTIRGDLAVTTPEEVESLL
ncbi:sugar kinase [Halorarum halophilum]|uniref:Sugar kinase n=1 Tax=Halorarum halophilum TaxID=2743090 RepID=A0A7D5GDR2_9EURY|nr:bifunctional 2-dehydro-3-deoxygluconokinase/2-dehydro-3-deoxygalactonokinase [Halobaculum halophilum]QLG29226.1 sugar kinase [Halobaculum halophilum]